jgi:uncharacterized protein YndB with AHSA1/START domain
MTDERHGVLEPAGDDWQLVFTRRLPHPPEKVWRAITEAEHVSKWFPADIVGERVEGADLEFVFREDEGPTLPGTMRVFDPCTLLEFTWSDEVIRFELTPEDDGAATRLRFVNTFGDVGKAARDAAGWHVCLDAFDAVLDGAPGPGPDRWRELNAHYVEAFPAEASTVGPPELHS